MFKTRHGVELILGAKIDPTFGAVMLLGAGGVTAELLHDRVLDLPPLNERLARRMVDSLRLSPLLTGYRDKPAVDLEKLIEVLIRLSYFIADHPAVTELDINPLVVSPEGAMALDARMSVAAQPERADGRPYAHLAIRPYPEQYVRSARMRDGTPVVLRPIKPEDEPLWHELLESCSPQSIRWRFFSLIKQFTHEMATRYCCIDYDREMAIVPELTVNGNRKLLGVGRLVADPDHDSAEYAVIVADAWQGRGLGLLLTDYCLQIARNWGVRRVTAVTLADNERMIATLREYGFSIQRASDEPVVQAEKRLQ